MRACIHCGTTMWDLYAPSCRAPGFESGPVFKHWCSRLGREIFISPDREPDAPDAHEMRDRDAAGAALSRANAAAWGKR